MSESVAERYVRRKIIHDRVNHPRWLARARARLLVKLLRSKASDYAYRASTELCLGNRKFPFTRTMNTACWCSLVADRIEAKYGQE